MVTLIFAAIHYYSPEETATKDEEWSVKILEKAPEPSETVKIFDVAIETFFLCVGWVVISRMTTPFTLSVSDSIIIPMMNMTNSAWDKENMNL